nr:vacuolar protein sorting-associated protein 13C-like [Ciona intestinalis]|eukprot:XP_018672980.1 vacuolar protein sorting-associated protein 13C-like [Ciona intestinalis]
MNVLSVHISVRTWDTNMKLSLETFDVVQPQFQTADNTPLVLMNSEVSSDSDTLFHGEIIQVNPKSPDFVQLYNRTKQLVFVRFGSLCITAHVQAVLKLQSFVSSLTHLLESQAAKVIEPTVAAHETSEKSDLATKSDVSIIPFNVKDSDSKVVDLKLTARIDAVRVNLVDEKEEISIVEIEGIKSSVSITKQWIKLNAELHKLKVTDTDIKTLYPDVVQSDGDEVILLEFVNYNNPNTGVDSDVNKPHAVDGSLKLKLGCVKVVFLNKFVEKLQKYGNSLSQGKEILEAGSAAQEIAVAKAQELMLTNPLILIDMKLSAPTIIVPKHSQSLEVLVVDLGVLKAVNQFSQTSVLDIGSRVVDELKLSLHDVQVLYRDVNEDKVVVREENILQPTDLEIEVIRNLSSAWFHGIPDVSVNAVLHKLSVAISQQNLKFILQALELNFQEGTTDAMEEKSESNSDSKTTIVSEQSLPLQESPQEDRDLLHFSFRLENMELKLFVDEKREEDLSKLSFVNIVGSMRDASDLSRVLTLSLEDLLLVDNREHHTGVVTHLIKRKQTVDNGSVLINMKYNQRVDNADGEIEVSNLSLIISVEFYLKLASFFMDGFNVVSEKQSSTSQALQSSSDTDLKKLPQKSESSDSQKSVSSSKMTVNMNDLEILIIRDFHSTQSEAFILALNSTLKYDESGKTQLIDANVRDLTMVRCLYETFVKQKQLGKSRFKEILSPCNISAHGLMTETVQDFHLSINDIQLKISPSVVTTFNDILAQLYPITEQGGNASTKNTTAGRPAFNFSSMKIQDLNSKVMSEVKSTSVDPPTVATRNVIRETGNLSIGRIQVQLEVGCGQHTIPLLLLQLSLNATVEDWSAGEMSGDCTLTMVAAYFNDNLSVWEPLVEPVEKNPGTLEAKYEPWKVRARLQQKSQDNQRFLNSDEPLMVFTIESEQVLETNISNTGLKVINTLTSNFMGDTSADEFQNNKSLTQSRLRIQQESAAFVVTNYLGRNINFIHGDGLTVVGDSLESDSGNESSLCKLSWSSWVAGGSPETELLRSKPENASSQLILLKVKFEDKLLPFQSSEGKKAVDIHFRTEAILCNFLPIPINYSVLGIAYEGFVNQLESAHSAQLLDLEISKSKLKVKIPSYQGQSWSAVLDLQENMNELTDWTFSNAENKGINLNLAKRITYTNGVLKVELFSPYWLMNHTGLVLDYKSNVDNIVMQSRNENIMLFAFSSRAFLSKNKLQLRVCNSEFSDGFTIDAVGSSGFVTCKSKSCNYIIGTEIMMSSFSLTKMIVFKPFYRFSNKSTLDVEFSVSGLKVPVWHTVESGKVVPFWPEVSSSTLVVRLKNTTSASDKITFNKMESGFLFKISNTTLFVDVSLSECSNIISVRDYFEGSSALLVINDTPDNNLVFRHDKNEEVISAGYARHLLWSTPSNSRKFQWVYCNEQNTIDIAFNKLASFKCNETMIYYVIFSDGLQKSFLLTTNEKRAHFTESFFKFEKPTLQLNVSLHGLVCSFIDSTLHQEVATMSVISSGVVWEEKQNKRWKALPVKYNNFLEDVYQKQLKGHGSAGTVSLDKYEFDLMKMQTKKPNQKDLQRSFSAGIWMRVNSSEHQKSFHAKINKVQIDSQLFGAVFPVILNPVPLPASVAVDNVAKPFIELSMMQEVTENEAVFHVKYCKVLIQEFSVKLDMGLLTSILPVFGGNEDEIDDNEVVKYFAEDLQFLANDKSSSSSASNSIIYFDQLHLSPLKVHISLSMQNKVEDKEDSSLVKLPFNALYVLMQSIGITLSDMDDIVFKLAYFERRFQFFNGSELQDSVMNHYKGQAIKQLYVLVFGLDVIGNPYGLVMGLADGVTSLFYEPYQGMIQGPEEFFEGLGLGTLNLLGQTLGGAAGAVSKVTGALGKGIATITMDDEYQKKRLEAKNKQPANMKESLARGGKGAVMGLFSGVTGIVSKPIEGAKKGGASGFFKGVGKGLVGVVARPVSGVIDLASTTLEGVQRVTDMTEEVRKLRPSRWINPETGIIQPYSLKHATGFAIFNEIEKGKFVEDNHYVDHVPTRADDKSVVLITDKLLMVAHTGEILGQWKSDWFCNFQDILAEPTLVDKVLTVEFKENQKFFPRNRSNQNTVTIPNESNARYIHARIVDMWKRSTI